MKKSKIEPVCSLDYAFRRIGGKYKGRILWHIYLSNNVLRYGELKRKLKNVTPKMLTQSLRELEQDNLINRKVYKVVPPKVEYSLTDNGCDLIPFLSHLKVWADKQLEVSQPNIGKDHFFQGVKDVSSGNE